MKRRLDDRQAPYQTDDVEERNMTLAMKAIFASMAKAGATEDLLAVFCRCLVRNTDNIQFAYYCYAEDETGVVAAIRPGAKFFMPPPDVQRKIAAQLRAATKGGKVAVIGPHDSFPFLTAAQRKKWECHQGMAFPINVGGKDVAVISVHVKPDYIVTDRHRAWLSLVRDAVTALMTQRQAFVRAEEERSKVGKARLELSATLETARTRVREHLDVIEQVKSDYRSGTLSLKEAVGLIEKSARTLTTLSVVPACDENAERVRFRDKALSDWMEAGMGDPRTKALIGIRGSDKSGILHAVRRRILASGVDESRVVIIDFEHPRFRRFKTVDDVMNYLAAFPSTSGVNYLFLDEIGMISWHTQLLSRLRSNRNWNVWIAASTSHAFTSAFGKNGTFDVMVYHTWVDPNVPRARSELEKVWCQIFMRDVVSGVDHPDIRAKENLAEYYSDHLGEVKSLRDVSKDLSANGRRISIGTIRLYRQALVDAQLIEFSRIYDVFEGAVVTAQSGRAFYTDLELRSWRFGSAPEKDETRVALNRLYLDLRRKYSEVFTPRDADADFLTLTPDRKPLLWKLRPDASLSPFDFRGGGVNSKKSSN